MISDVTCRACDGSGRDDTAFCLACGGFGAVPYFCPTLPDDPAEPEKEVSFDPAQHIVKKAHSLLRLAKFKGLTPLNWIISSDAYDALRASDDAYSFLAASPHGATLLGVKLSVSFEPGKPTPDIQLELENHVTLGEADLAPTDPVVEKVRADLLARSQVGIKKYGTTLAASGLSEDEFMQHAYEEALDLANYFAGMLLKREAKK